ncbi:MAG TPA: VWA domain-containing protein [Pyrinomonadaceae bacterium]|nr:VWA domain-containing protein [Pyrinomonadaceae bacterium]
MSRRKKTGRAFVAVLLPALLLLASAPPRRAQEQKQQEPPPPPPPAQRMRREAGDQAREPASPSDNQAPVGDDDVVRVDTELATVLLTAIDRDRRFVTTLRREDVRVVEDGVPQELTVFERETDLPLTLAILIDTSRSQERTLPDEKAAARAFIDSVLRPDRDRAAVISFTGEAVLQQDLTNDPGKLREAVERVAIEFPMGAPECEGNVTPERELRCYTGVWDAAWVTVNDVLSQTPAQSRRAIILLTDGKDSSSMTKRQEAIDLAVKHNVVIYSIGIGDDEFEGIADDALRKLSERTGGSAFFPESRQELGAAFARIQQELRSQYFLAYRPSNTRRDGGFRQVRVEVVNPELRKQKLQLLYRQGYYARSAPRPK